jgi:hypothetical protein
MDHDQLSVFIEPNDRITPLVMEAITQAVIAETIIYGRRETGFVEGKEVKFELSLTGSVAFGVYLRYQAATNSTGRRIHQWQNLFG